VPVLDRKAWGYGPGRSGSQFRGQVIWPRGSIPACGTPLVAGCVALFPVALDTLRLTPTVTPHPS
jgi:hypothetical protein